MNDDEKRKKRIAGMIAFAAAIAAAIAAAAVANSNTDAPAGDAPDPKVTGDKLAMLHPKMRGQARKFVESARKLGIDLRVTSTYRSIAKQNELYGYGRTDKSKGIVTNARGGQSYHNYGLAMDVVPYVDGKPDWKTDWAKLGALGKAHGLEWGGDFKTFVDRPHFQMKFGKTTTELKAMIDAGRVDADGYVIL